MLSEADHRLNHVQNWAEKRPKNLQGCLGADVNSADFTDDRLAVVLDKLSEDRNWSDFEAALNRRTLRVYNLKRKCVRLDSTTANGYWEVTEDGLFQFGHSKDHRPDQPQVKVMLATLDPLGMPVAVQVVSGEKADDPLYIPAIEQVRRGLTQAGLSLRAVRNLCTRIGPPSPSEGVTILAEDTHITCAKAGMNGLISSHVLHFLNPDQKAKRYRQ